MDAPASISMSKQNQFPVKTKQVAVDVNGINTDVVCSQFENHFFIIVTQNSKIGNMVEVTKDVVLEEVATSRPTYSTRVLLGIDEPLTHVIAKNLVSKLDTTKSVILSVCLKDNSPKNVSSLSDVIKSVIV